MFLSQLKISENVNLNKSMFGWLLLLCILLRIPSTVFFYFILGILEVMRCFSRREDQVGRVTRIPSFS